MKISKLISKLEIAKKQYGDLELIEPFEVGEADKVKYSVLPTRYNDVGEFDYDYDNPNTVSLEPNCLD